MIKSLIRAIDILELLSRGKEKKYSVAEISNRTKLPPSTVHRILTTLCDRGLVNKESDSRLYYLGVRLISLGIKAQKFVSLAEMATPILNELAAKTGEDSYMIIKSGNKGLFLTKVDGPHPLKIIDTYGPEVDLHCGAIRRCLLAYQDNRFIDQYIAAGLKSYTEHTIVEADKLKASLQQIRKEGSAVSRAEYINEAIGIGAPVLSRGGFATAAIGIIAPITRVEDCKIKTIQQTVKALAYKLSAQIGYVAND